MYDFHHHKTDSFHQIESMYTKMQSCLRNSDIDGAFEHSIAISTLGPEALEKAENEFKKQHIDRIMGEAWMVRGNYHANPELPHRNLEKALAAYNEAAKHSIPEAEIKVALIEGEIYAKENAIPITQTGSAHRSSFKK